MIKKEHLKKNKRRKKHHPLPHLRKKMAVWETFSDDCTPPHKYPLNNIIYTTFLKLTIASSL
jgi:hypothetical protein